MRTASEDLQCTSTNSQNSASSHCSKATFPESPEDLTLVTWVQQGNEHEYFF